MADISLLGIYIWMKKSLLAFDILFTVFGYNIKHFLVFDVLSSIGNQMKPSYSVSTSWRFYTT